MGLIRAFIALDIPDEIKSRIAQAVAPLVNASQQSVRWVSPENIHLTIKFLGDVSPNQLELLTHTLASEARALAPFTLQIGGLGCFPNPRRPRVIWVGVQAPAELAHLQHAIESAAGKIGYPPEEKPFSPHLTIGRVRSQSEPPALLRSLLEQSQAARLGAADIHAVHLYRSELKPGGAIYSHLCSAPLGDQEEPR